MDSVIIREILGSAALFLFMWFVLSRVFFKPYLGLLIEREERTSGDEKRAQERREEARAMKHSIEDSLQKTRIESLAKRDEAVAKARAEGQKVVEEANKRAQAELQKGREEVAQLKAAAAKELEPEADKLAGEVLNRLLSRESARVMHVLLFGILLLPQTAHAAGGPGGIGTLFFPAINFVLYVCLMTWLYKKKGGASALRARSAQIREGLKQAANTLAEATSELEGLRERRASIEQEKASLASRYDEETENLVQMTERTSEDAARRLESDTGRQIESELMRAEKELRAEVIRLASDKARMQIAAEFSEQDDRELREQALSGIEAV